jgi:hypothetical protein
MIDAADLELFEQSLRHANEGRTGSKLDAALVDLGWHDALAVDPHAAISIHFELQGRAGATSSALGHVVASSLGIDEPMAVVLPALGRWAPPGQRRGDHVVVDGICAFGLAVQDRVLVAAAGGDENVVVVVPASALTVRAVSGLDPDLSVAHVTGEARAAAERASGDWGAAVDLARLAVAHELTGASRTMLDLARTHALERMQFGQPIAAFQAVRHRLAEALVAIETAAAMLDAAWLEPTPQTAAMAKAVAGRSARTVAKHCQQVLAGIGFTTEHSFHRYLRRILVLDELFGSARTLTRSLGEEVLESGQLPPLLKL